MAAVIRYEPFVGTPAYRHRDSVGRAFERLFEDAFGPAPLRRTRPAIASNLYETPEAYWVDLPLPAVKADDVQIIVHENVLVIQVKRQWAAPESSQPIWQGFQSEEWTQRLTLPGEVDSENVDATLEHGVLRLRVSKAARAEPRTIKIATPGAAEAAPPEAAPAAV